MNTSDKLRLHLMKGLRRDFWIGTITWAQGLLFLTHNYGLTKDAAVDFLGDSTNLDSEASAIMKANSIPFGVSLVESVR